MSAGARRDAAAEWLAWCRRYVDESKDPLIQTLAMPAIRRPTWEERVALENAFVHKLEREKARMSRALASDQAGWVRQP